MILKENDCWLCGGSGALYENLQTKKCPICSVTPEIEPGWHQDVWPCFTAKHYGKRFSEPPWLLVIHSGSIGSNIAEYFSNPADNRKVSTHLAWSDRVGTFVQCVPMSHIAWHVGGSKFPNYSGNLNSCSIGIELPGPWNKERDMKEHQRLRSCVKQILRIVPSLTHAVKHRDIDKNKKDPGNLNIKCLVGLGLIL